VPEKSGPSIYLVALSGYGQPDDRRQAMEAGFDAHLVKPVNPDALLAALQSGGQTGGKPGGQTGGQTTVQGDT
jgi:CheY-like chemotaxis protein